MQMFIRQEVHPHDVPIEFVKSAFAYLEAAEKLNGEMAAGKWPGDYRNAQVILWLTFHATELFLKGCIAKLDPAGKVLGHTLPRLKNQLESLAGKVELQLPFDVEGADSTPEIEALIKNHLRTTHERLRYPTDQDGVPWSGLQGFSPQLFADTLQDFKCEAGALQSRLFPE